MPCQATSGSAIASLQEEASAAAGQCRRTRRAIPLRGFELASPADIRRRIAIIGTSSAEETVKVAPGIRVRPALAAGIVGLGVGQAVLQQQADAQGSNVQAPVFEVDPLWPKPLPNNWLLGWTIGVWVDEHDHIWVIHRGAGGLHNNEQGAELNPPIAECCRTAPPVLVYDSGRLACCARGAVRARAMSGRSPTTASMSTTRAMSGSAATARRMRTS